MNLVGLLFEMLPENCFLFSRDEVVALGGSRLFGYGITDDAIIIGTGGLNEYFSNGASELPENGRFCGIFEDGEGDIVIKTDVTGQEMLYLYQDGEDWALSNSFMLLAKKAGLRAKLDAYDPAIACFHLKQGAHIGEQLISHRTMVEQIRIVPLTAEVRVNRVTKQLTVSERPYFDLFSFAAGQSYAETLLDFLERGAGVIAALAKVGMPIWTCRGLMPLL